MPKIKRNSRTTRKTTDIENIQNSPDISSSGNKILSPRNIIIAAVLILALLVWKFKGSFIAATVNGQPISRFELNDLLVRRFGTQTLDNIISERLILAAVRQKGIFIISSEIDAKVKEVEERLRGKATLDEALLAQGLTMPMFRRQLEIQLSIEKLFDKEATVSGEEIDDYYEKNSSLYKNATDTAAVKDEIKSILRQQKVNDFFEKWFAEIRKNAKINKYL